MSRVISKEEADALRAELARLGTVPPRGVSYGQWLEDAVDRNKLAINVLAVAPDLLSEAIVDATATRLVEEAERTATNARNEHRYVAELLEAERAELARTRAEVERYRSNHQEMIDQAARARAEARAAGQQASAARAAADDANAGRQRLALDMVSVNEDRAVALDDKAKAERKARAAEDARDEAKELERQQRQEARRLDKLAKDLEVERDAVRADRDAKGGQLAQTEQERATARAERDAERAAKLAGLAEIDSLRSGRAADAQELEARAARIEQLEADLAAEKAERKVQRQLKEAALAEVDQLTAELGTCQTDFAAYRAAHP